jgi:hypothetical protein
VIDAPHVMRAQATKRAPHRLSPHAAHEIESGP